eukprot:gnl/TRDRNA2_/TRDRNA2_184410_c0_seq1.p1 gnl/TRDRNA2_/TRDRNA2_184410_c0~~gnl/TRDRNA2_/TRDRNA2_184410_c0_seq1.p1  ORF type:complete len:361 (-),score=81.00 gnl/TRDRNA2_/TRDRNA2_184410_c0_seq1:76-1158(-)
MGERGWETHVQEVSDSDGFGPSTSDAASRMEQMGKTLSSNSASNNRSEKIAKRQSQHETTEMSAVALASKELVELLASRKVETARLHKEVEELKKEGQCLRKASGELHWVFDQLINRITISEEIITSRFPGIQAPPLFEHSDEKKKPGLPSAESSAAEMMPMSGKPSKPKIPERHSLNSISERPSLKTIFKKEDAEPWSSPEPQEASAASSREVSPVRPPPSPPNAWSSSLREMERERLSRILDNGLLPDMPTCGLRNAANAKEDDGPENRFSMTLSRAAGPVRREEYETSFGRTFSEPLEGKDSKRLSQLGVRRDPDFMRKIQMDAAKMKATKINVLDGMDGCPSSPKRPGRVKSSRGW